MDAYLLQASDLEASEHEPLLGSAEESLYAPPLPKLLHQPVCASDHEVLTHLEGVLDPGVPPYGDDWLCVIVLGFRPDFSGAVLGICEHRTEPDAEAVDPFEQRLEIGLVVLVAWGDGEGEGHLGFGAACGVHPVSEDEAPLSTPHPGVGIAPPRLVVQAPLAVGLQVGVVDGYDLSPHHLGVEEPPEELIEDSVVGLLPEAMPEVGEEAVAGCVLLEAAGSGCLPVVLQPEGEPSVAGDTEELLQQLGLQHGQWVVRPPSRASPVVEASQHAA